MEWVATSINPEDAQFLATRQFQVVEIVRMLRLPPHKIGGHEADEEWAEERRARNLVGSGHAEIVKEGKK